MRYATEQNINLLLLYFKKFQKDKQQPLLQLSKFNNKIFDNVKYILETILINCTILQESKPKGNFHFCNTRKLF